jgi:aspartyl-tRNA(Asn)/glutamyl-tRNA(Gln) amidotransferase subunit A
MTGTGATQVDKAESGGAAVGDLANWTLREASSALDRGEVTSSELTSAILERIASFDGKLNSYITVCDESAMAQARLLDAEHKRGSTRGPLHGIPIALKDNIDTAGVRTTAASNVFRERIPTEDAEVTKRLKAAGAVIVGKLNLHEFAAGGTGAESAFGATHNPWDLDRVTGGSSSGSGAAVGGRLCFGALGTDTGGSIRIPSSWCGTVGMKPTYGLVSIRGIVPLIYSMDHCGPMTRSVTDSAIMLNVLAGYDPLDNASVEHPQEDYVKALEQPTHSMRLGAPEEYYSDLDVEVESAIKAAIEVLTTLTAGVASHAPLPPAGDMMDFLHFKAETLAYHEPYKDRPELYLDDTRHFLTVPIASSSQDYVRARERLIALRRSIDGAFKDFDLVVLPTEKLSPYTIAEAIEFSKKASANPMGFSPEIMKIAANTFPFNMYGLPAMTVPCGFTASGLPIGMTIAGRRFSEGKILALGAAFEKATVWHERRPALLE